MVVGIGVAGNGCAGNRTGSRSMPPHSTSPQTDFAQLGQNRSYGRAGSVGDRSDARPTSAGAPAKNHTAISESNTKHPSDDVGMNGQIGLPHN